jgi:secreted PhoX family phosphatase
MAQQPLPGFHPSRRGLLKGGAFGGLGLSLFGGPTVIAAPSPASAADGFGPLLPPNQDGLQLPAGFASRIVAVSNQVVPGTSFVWHTDPDGGATFATPDGGWVYVSNAERLAGGTNAIRFAADGAIQSAYRILNNTLANCAGGPTPWGRWLSCEETPFGRVYECDPFTPNSQGVARPAMGVFQHEAAAVDPIGRAVYLTEDREDGLFYRFRPTNYPNLSSGVLEACQVLDPQGQGPIAPGQERPLVWFQVPDPTVQFFIPTRFQVPQATRFNGGEGCWYEGGLIHFTTKGNNRVWKLDPATQRLSIVYDLASSANPQLSGVDNVFVAPGGDVFVAEDGGNMEIVALTSSGAVKPVVRVFGTSGSEITGPALSPDGTRLYFSSQRNPGRTYEVSGPWLGQKSTAAVPALGNLASALTAAALAATAALLTRRDELAVRGPQPTGR